MKAEYHIVYSISPAANTTQKLRVLLGYARCMAILPIMTMAMWRTCLMATIAAYVHTLLVAFPSASRLRDNMGHQKVGHDMGRSNLPGMRGIVPVSRREGRKEDPPVRVAKERS